MKPSLILGLAWALAAVPGARAGTLALDRPQSWVEVDVKATVGTFIGRLAEFDFSAHGDPAGDEIATGVFRADFASLTTGNAARDRDMNDWQQTGKYPEVVFSLDELASAPDGSRVARGRLRLHGVERALILPVLIAANQQTLVVTGEVPLDTRDYGLPVIRTLLVLKVDPIVHVRFHVQLRRIVP